jgi:hypothetical protein
MGSSAVKSLNNLTDEVYSKVRLLGHAWGVDDNEVIRRLLEHFQQSMEDGEPDGATATELRVHAIFDKVRTEAVFDRSTKSITIVGGPLAGQAFASPSGAAGAIIKHYRPDINPSRNGWSFWTVSSDGKLLQSVR